MWLVSSPRFMILAATTRFALETLNNPDYLLYNVDIMELCQEYFNSDVTVDGTVMLNDVRDLGFSMDMDVQGERSFEQKKFAASADMNVVFLEVGDAQVYAEDEMAYMVVPMLDNLSYAFDTDMNLFFKAPEFTSDINQEWFNANKGNILQLSKEISIEKMDEIVDENNWVSIGYKVTIPEGSGGFIWQLLGVEAPDHDVVSVVYINPACQIRRIEIDLDDAIEPGSTIQSAKLVLDGTNMGNMYFEATLPDDETVISNVTRNGDYLFTNYIDFETKYFTNTGETYAASGYMTWEKIDGGVSVEVHNMEITDSKGTIGKIYFRGNVNKSHISHDVFEKAPVDLYSIEVISWKKLRDDTEGFVRDMMSETKRRIGLPVDE
ncbi:MAG: hypothetical protein IJ655_05050 [Lachnospiraceae bacterium]|nr:hypothetical protein [Lachnospiraceae bacterium]